VTSWVSAHREDITFIAGLVAGLVLIGFGIARGDTGALMLGAGALGIGGYDDVVKG